MFLLEHAKGMFINAEDIQSLMVGDKFVVVTLKSDPNNGVCVDYEFQRPLLNHLQSLNGNITNVECAYAMAQGEKV